MKRIIILLFVCVFSFSNDLFGSDGFTFKTMNESLLYTNHFDPGHGKQLKNKSKWPELYFGLQPSVAIKYNFSWNSNVTESSYMMMGMDFDSDLFLKFGVLLNKGTKRSQNRSLSNPKFGWIKLWRYVLVRQGLELGYKGQFLDAEEDELLNTNYGGMTVNYTVIFDGNFLFDKTSWYFLDHRTARRIRLKVDAGLFLNFDKFNQHDLDFLSGSNDATGMDYNDEVVDLSGQPLLVNTYPVLSPFVNLSIGFAF